MTDDYSVEGEAPADPLTQFVGLFKTGTGQDLANEAAIRLNDYQTKRQIAESNLAAGQAFHNNLAEMRGNYIGMVQDDPAATHLALDLADLGTRSMVGTIPGVDPEHVQNISTGMQQDIARASVMSLADQHEGQARDMLANDRISGLLGDEKDSLSGYIQSQAVARQIDAEAQQKAAQRAAVDQANQSAWRYMATITNPDTGEITPPAGWAQRLMADPSMPPHYKASLFDTYGRLTEQGDAPFSDPLSVHDVVRDAAAGSAAAPAVLARAGDDLRAADAVYLSRLAGDPSQQGRAAQLAAVLDQGKEALAGPENGPAGTRAFGDFTSWALSAARAGASLDPASKDYALQGNKLQQFAPRASYNVEAAVQVPPQDRRPLSEIFGGKPGVRSSKR